MVDAIFVKATTKEWFNNELNSGNIGNGQIAFILDTHEIWTHGQFFSCPYTKDQIDQIIANKQDIIDANNMLSSDLVQYTEGEDTYEYVEIAGIKWATMNVGANSVTDYGLYFQWGDTQGYTADQLGSGEGQKAFTSNDYKYATGSTMTKYNSTDGKTVLDAEDDAVTAAWGINWRMPTNEELQALSNATTQSWTDDYQGSGVAGMVCTDKTDSSKVLFFPAAGRLYNSRAYYIGQEVHYWTDLLVSSNSNSRDAYYITWKSKTEAIAFNTSSSRYAGQSVRGVLDIASKTLTEKIEDIEDSLEGKADKSEMSVVDGTGADADKTTITLKSGTSATVLKSHQSLSGKQDVIDSSHKLSADLVEDGSTNKVYTATEKTKLSNIESGAQVNVKPDWNAASGNVAEILNKPDVYTKTEVDDKFLVIDANGHAYVDLGLPSGTLWATMNVGAESVTDGGNFYGYGKGSDTYDRSQPIYTGDENPLSEEYDTAAQVWGNGWYTPTKDQFDELVDNTIFTVETDPNDNTTVIAGKFTAKNGNYIILPAAGQVTPNQYNMPTIGTGYYQTSTPIENQENNLSYVFEFYNNGAYTDTGSRGCGYKVRPVHDSFNSLLINKEDLSNKVTSLSAQSTHTEYPSAKAVYDNLPTTMGASGSGHKGGLVPDTPSTAGITKFLREDGTWNVPDVDVSGKEDKIAIDSTAKTSSFTASVGNYYTVNIPASSSIMIALDTPSDNTKLSNAIFLVTTSTAPALFIDAANGVNIYKAKNYSIEANSIYEVNAVWNGVSWSVASVELELGSVGTIAE